MAARFQFGLSRVRDLRAHVEDQAKEQFAASLNYRAHGEAMLRAVEYRLDLARTEQTETTDTAALSGMQLRTHQAFLERLERSRRDAIVELQNRDARLMADRHALARASQDREVLDKLEDRQRVAHDHAAARAQSAEIDDIAIRNYVRRQAA